MFSPIVRNRYLSGSWPQLVDRLISGPIWKMYKFGPISIDDTEKLHWALANQVFIPAGNTLTFNAPVRNNSLTQKLRPNCAIKLGISTEAAVRLWSQGTGFGTTSLLDENPVEHITRLQDAWNLFKDPEHRPKRGNMYVYPASGKYIMDFIRLKSDPSVADKFPAFNVSVGFNDFELDNVRNRDILPAIADAAWRTGDPGVVFLDRVNQNVPLKHYGDQVKTLVPCGEQGMFEGESCTLGSINLHSKALLNPDGNFSLTKFEVAIRTAVRFLDNAVDVVETDAHTSNQYRRIGLGVMGWADHLEESLGMDYGSPLSADYAATLSKFMGAIARHESGRLALEKGPFPAWLRERININFDVEQRDVLTLIQHGYPFEAAEVMRVRQRHGMRNISVTCIAPTGGINLITGNKGFAIEPAFEDAGDLTVSQHLQMLHAWQSGMCNSVSKTINFASKSTPQDFLDAILEARRWPWIKALSMYRTGSRVSQPM
jgi:ribonucleoside-diphosphate reductase alpha chain